MLERKSYSDSQSSEVFDGILIDKNTEKFGFVIFYLNGLSNGTWGLFKQLLRAFFGSLSEVAE